MYPDPASHPPLPPSSPPRRSPDHGERSASEVRGSAPESFFSPQENSFWPLQKLQGIMHEVKLQYKAYEDAAVQKVKDGFVIVTEHPAAASGAAIFSGLLLMRAIDNIGLRKVEEEFTGRDPEGFCGVKRYGDSKAQLSKVDSGLKELGPSVEKLKKDSKNMILRASFGEEELQRGRTKIRDAGKEIQRLVKSIYKIESQAADVIDGLRVIPGRDALKLRAEIASMTSDLRQQRRDLDRKILKISEHGIPV
ncbi:hypothetical protein MA16_Dca018931 [Dendrobium catenatum]|uniref:Uncharacterized protein n=1 Tax=Dendrobium catenatum TaxID=906689 RepID=A0A2I0VU29_9ASPA|nr:hypothetical protein MA16_Dca018931 [Dendrobium catenatum]